jgi:TolB-like protein
VALAVTIFGGVLHRSPRRAHMVVHPLELLRVRCTLVAHTRQPRIIVTARLASAQGSRSLWAPRFSKAQRY